MKYVHKKLSLLDWGNVKKKKKEEEGKEDDFLEFHNTTSLHLHCGQ